MPELTGLDLMDAMKSRRLNMPIIVITGHADVPLAVQAMKQGAIDFLEKPFDRDALLSSVRHAFQTKSDETSRHAAAQAIMAKVATLTKREREVLARLLKGHQNKIIAYELGISVRTVEVHRAMVMAKMEARNLPELVQMALAVPREEIEP